MVWGRGRRWPRAGAEVLTARPRCNISVGTEKVPVPFIFLSGDVTSVRWFVGIVQGRAAGGGVVNQGGEHFYLPLLDLPWWLGSSPFPLKTL